MADVVSPEVRSRMMAGIRSTNTKPELILRQGLHRAGFRFRLHNSKLPGRPDIVLPQYRAVIFANGCFWHGHNCHLFKVPATRPDFWMAKIAKNRSNDRRAIDRLILSKWRCAVVWECALRGKARLPHEDVVSACAGWLTSKRKLLEIRGRS
jgi:DNA mismatch endonuclease (patch repair protein)